MHVHRRSQTGAQRDPEWTHNDDTFRQVVLACLEDRVYIAPQPDKTYDERLAAVRKRAQVYADGYLPKLKALLQAHRKASAARRDALAIQIQNLDTQIVTAARLVENVCAVAYLSYRLGYKSPEIAAQLGLKPPNVRIIRYRLNRTWQRLVKGKRPPRRAPKIVRMERTPTGVRMTLLYRKRRACKPIGYIQPKPGGHMGRRLMTDTDRIVALSNLGWPVPLIAMEMDRTWVSIYRVLRRAQAREHGEFSRC